MSVRFNGNVANYLSITATPDYNSAYTLMGWVAVTTDRNAITTIFCVARDTGGSSNSDNINTSSTGTALRVQVILGGAGTVSSTYELVTGRWYHMAMVRESATSLKLYVDGFLRGTVTTNVAARNSPATRMQLSGRVTGSGTVSEPLDGRVVYCKCWSKALNSADIKREMGTVLAIDRDRLHGEWPLVTGNSTGSVFDLSGNRRNWTITGTVTYEPDPPLPWQTLPPVMWYSTGTLFTQALAGTLTSSGALTRQGRKALAGTVTSSGTVTKRTSRSLVGALTSSGSLVKRTIRTLAGTLTSSGTLSATRVIMKLLTGTLTSSGTLTRMAGKRTAGTVTSSGTLVRRTSRSLTGTLTSSGTLTRRTLRSLAGVLTSSGSLSKRISVRLAGTLTSSGTLTAGILGGAIQRTISLIGRMFGFSMRGEQDTIELRGEQDTPSLRGEVD